MFYTAPIAVAYSYSSFEYVNEGGFVNIVFIGEDGHRHYEHWGKPYGEFHAWHANYVRSLPRSEFSRSRIAERKRADHAFRAEAKKHAAVDKKREVAERKQAAKVKNQRETNNKNAIKNEKAVQKTAVKNTANSPKIAKQAVKQPNQQAKLQKPPQQQQKPQQQAKQQPQKQAKQQPQKDDKKKK